MNDKIKRCRDTIKYVRSGYTKDNITGVNLDYALEALDELTKVREDLEGQRQQRMLWQASDTQKAERIKELQAELSRATSNNKIAVEALRELKHQSHHTIAEEMWRIDKALDMLAEEGK